MSAQGENSQATIDLLQACWNHDLPTISNLLQIIPTSIQEPHTLHTPLHKAILSLKHLKEHDPELLTKEKCNQAEEAVRLLFSNGAIWNDLDTDDKTPGCYAYELGDDFRPLYEVIVDAGVRAELLLQTLDGYIMLGEGHDKEDEEEDEREYEVEPTDEENQNQLPQKGISQTMGVGLLQDQVQTNETHRDSTQSPSVNPSAYLSSRLTYHTDKLLDSALNGVMMSWEDTIMRLSAHRLLRTDQSTPLSPLRILNIGYGLGLIDNHLQSHPTHKPTAHTIIEPHQDVLDRIRDTKFDQKSGVRILEGRWQDVLPDLVSKNEIFDGIYFDTFAEDYSAFKEFFQEYVIALLNPEGGRFSFFNGLGADRRICYDVYQKVLELDFFEAGLDMDWESISIPQGEGAWDGVRRKYWVLDVYRLPVCTFMDGF